MTAEPNTVRVVSRLQATNLRPRDLISPIALAIYPVLFLLAQNLDQVVVSQAVRSLVFSFLLLLVVFVLSFIGVRDWTKAGLITSGALILFFSYGHVYELLKEWANLLARHRYLVPIWGLALAAWVIGTWRRKQDQRTKVLLITVVSVSILVVSGWPLLMWYLPTSGTGRSLNTNNEMIEAPNLGGPIPDRPDIYYIVLDGYGRQDVLAELFNYDNSDFTSALEKMGFTIASASLSNYGHTSLSLAATLNLNYVNDLAGAMEPDSKDLRPLEELIENSAVREIFEALGYQFVAFETGLPYTTITTADIYLVPDYSEDRQDFALLSGLELNEFEGMFLETTLGRVALDHYIRAQSNIGEFLTGFPYKKHRNRVLFTISSLSDFAEREGEFFVFAHVISPHPPFVFGENGEEVSNTRPFSFQDDGCCTRDQYIQGYGDQAAFISSLVKLEIAEILARSEQPPIIVIQGDHGPGAYLAPSKNDSNLKERFAILNAMHLPGEGADLLYPGITPVNTFRLILQEYFGVRLELIQDESYFSPGARPYDLELIEREELEG
ncbi:MAG: hypothetical protein J4N82_10145 [Chloroflexi bacterium]|nr:hypothetical protein [Chloroflexota bacterium]